jgi:hypothetical protein
MPVRTILKLIFVMFFMMSPVSGAKEQVTLPDLYFLAVNSKSIHTTVLFNDVPLVDVKEGESIMSEIPVTGWLLPGDNTLKIIARAAPGAERITGEVSAAVYHHDNSSDVPKPLETYATIKFPAEESDLEKKAQSVEVTFDFSEELKAELWREAETLSVITESDKSEILSLVDGLGKAIVKGDIDKAIELQKYKIKDDALIEGNSSEEIEQALRANYAWLKDQKGIELRTYNPREIVYSLMAKNRVVKLTKSAGEEVLQIESSDLSIEVPVFVSKINGVWKIVR